MAEPVRPTNPFRTVTFGGYSREDVDGYLQDAYRLAQIQSDEISALKTQAARFEAMLEARDQDHALAMQQHIAELDAQRDRARLTRDELERAKIELSKVNERIDVALAERDNYQRLAERLAAEEQQTRDLLRAATRTAEDLKSEAKKEAEDIVARAEQTARHIEADARRRIDDLRKEYEKARRDYEEFLKQARDVAENLVRKLDDARSKWPA